MFFHFPILFEYYFIFVKLISNWEIPHSNLCHTASLSLSSLSLCLSTACSTASSMPIPTLSPSSSAPPAGAFNHNDSDKVIKKGLQIDEVWQWLSLRPHSLAQHLSAPFSPFKRKLISAWSLGLPLKATKSEDGKRRCWAMRNELTSSSRRESKGRGAEQKCGLSTEKWRM